MMPIPEYHRVTNDLFVWHGYDPECKVDCTSTAIRTPDGFVMIDPIRIEEQALERLVGDDKVTAVVLTSGNHQRGSLYERERLDIPIYAPEGAKGEVEADHWFCEENMLLGTFKVIALPGAAPGEIALLAPGVLVLGDALVNLNGLELLPDKYCTDSQQFRESVRKLLSLDFDMICFAHGLPIVKGAKEKLTAVI